MFGRGQGINYGGIPKLLAPEISLGGNFVYDTNGQYYSTTTIYGYIKYNDVNTSYETLLSIMNSSLCWWFLKNTGTVLANGYFRYKPTYLFPFPLPKISETEDYFLQKQVKDLMKETDDSIKEKLQNRINKFIYKLYGLNYNEIEIIEK